MTDGQTSKWNGAGFAVACGALILLFSLGIRHGFGLFLQPISLEQGWGSETFAFSIALQNPVWGISQPFVGMLADRFGAKQIIVLGALVYAVGLWAMSQVAGEVVFILGAGVLIGLGLAGTTFPVIFGAISRLVRPEQRSMAMGITMSVGSFGQFALVPMTLGLIGFLDWDGALMAPLAFGITRIDVAASPAAPDTSTVREALSGAFGSRDFWLLSLGFLPAAFRWSLSQSICLRFLRVRA